MNISTIRDLLADQPVLRDLEPADLDLMAGCGHNEVFAVGWFLAREGTPSNHFYVLREGRVAVQMHSPTGSLVVDTLGPGDLVGWSWMLPPYTWAFDVEVVEPTRAIVIDAECLRNKCETDNAFGYRLLKRFSGVIASRLQSTRVRLLDLYGGAHVR